MNVLDLNINITTRELQDLWLKLTKRVRDIRHHYREKNQISLKKAVKKFAGLRREYNRFYKHLIYQLATYNLFGTHLRKIIAYLGISSDFFRILHYYKTFFKLLITNSLTAKQLAFIHQQWEKLLLQEEKIRILFFQQKKKDILAFLKTTDSQTIGWEKDLGKKRTLAKELATFIEKGNMNVTLVFFDNMRGLNRIFGHFVAILEHLLLIADFALFKRYRDEKILA